MGFVGMAFFHGLHFVGLTYVRWQGFLRLVKYVEDSASARDGFDDLKCSRGSEFMELTSKYAVRTSNT